MKEVLGVGEYAEIRARTSAFARHLHSMDWDKVRDPMVRHKNAWESMVSVIMGVKPAVVFGDTELGDFNPNEFIPNELKPNFMLHIKKDNDTFQGWLVDFKQIGKVFKKYSEEFFNLDFERLADKAYINSYLRNLKTSIVGAKQIDVVRTGLALGFPYNSVVNFDTGHFDSEPFGHKGYEFSCDVRDSWKFKNWLNMVYKNSGMNMVLSENERRIKKSYAEYLKSVKPDISLTSINNRKYLQVKFVDTKKQIEGTQFLPVVYGKMDGSEVFGFINSFAKKFNLPHLRYKLPKNGKSGSMGVAYEAYFECITKSQTKNKVPYLTLDEGAVELNTGVMIIDRKRLKKFLQENGKTKEALMF